MIGDGGGGGNELAPAGIWAFLWVIRVGVRLYAAYRNIRLILMQASWFMLAYNSYYL